LYSKNAVLPAALYHYTVSLFQEVGIFTNFPKSLDAKQCAHLNG